MFCEYCGKWNHESAKFCPYCGAVHVKPMSKKQKRRYEKNAANMAQPMNMPYYTDQYAPAPTYPPYAPNTVQEESNGMATAGFVCSFFVPLLGWIFGGIGLARANKRNGKGKGFSIAALIIATVMALMYSGTV